VTRPGTVWSVIRAEGVRAALDRTLDRAVERRRARSFRPGRNDARPFGAPILHLLATPLAQRLGGVQGQLLRRLDAQSASGPTALLAPGAEGYRLELAAPDRRIAHSFPGGSGLAGVLDRALQLAGAQGLQIEGLAGYTLDELAFLTRLDIPRSVAVHDFAAFCRRPHLLEHAEVERFCHYSRDEARCLSCLRAGWPETGAGFQRQWRETTAALLAGARAVVYPSEFMRQAYSSLFPALDPLRQHVIAPASEPVARERKPLRPATVLRHAAFVGSVRVDKGGLVFAEAAERLAASNVPLRLSVLGGGDAEVLARLRSLPNVRIHGYYRQGSLPSWLGRLEIELALLLSIIPESYSLTFDETTGAGLPSLAFDLGALGPRVVAAGGIILPLGQAPAADLAGALAELARGERPMPLPPAPLAVSGADAAARAWLKVYRDAGLAGEGEPAAS
jgi:glycosyltransferase involved in cell wall biosynthesis